MTSFLNHTQPLLTVMLQCLDPETAIKRIKIGLEQGADAFGLQTESLLPEFNTKESITKILDAMEGKPCYVTNYRGKTNSGKSDEELAEGLVRLAEYGATLCDVMGDMFCRHPEELTDNPEAIEKQIRLIERIHKSGAEVLMSSHLHKYAPEERVLEIAKEQERRGVDIVKIVTKADNMDQQFDNLRITNRLKETIETPFLFLSGGKCSLHRRLSIRLGCTMALCVVEHDERSTKSQPYLNIMKMIRDQIDF